MSTIVCQECGSTIYGQGGGDEVCLSCLGRCMATFLTGPQSETIESVPEGSPPSLAPEFFGDYELLEKLDGGGMGLVFKARQRVTNRIVALKVIQWGPVCRVRAEARFVSEIETAATLVHPNIIPILDVGTEEDVPFYTMDFVTGGSWADDRNALKGEERHDRHKLRSTIRKVIKVARAVHFAHEHGIIHRDLKPSNILIGDDGEPYVSDFGVAKRLDDDAELTITGEVLGSPAYMAPEQVSGESAAQTIAVDIYSLGAILYRLLSGIAPFAGQTSLEILRRIETDEVKPLTGGRVPLDGDLVTITFKCLEKEPGRRYASASALAEDLERWIKGEAIEARPNSFFERSRKWCRRNPYRALTMGGGLLFISLFLFQFWWNAKLTERSRERIVGLLVANRRSLADQYVQAGNPGAAMAYLSANLRDVSEKAPAIDYLAWLAESRDFPYPLGPKMTHSSEVWELAFHPDGTRLATACYDGMGRIWSVETGQQTVPPLKHEGKVYRIDFSPDGEKVLTGSLDHSARVWDAATGQALSPPLRHSGDIHVAYFGPKGERIVTASEDCVVRIWRGVGAGEPLMELPHSKEEIVIHIAEWVPGKDQILTGSVLGNMWLWDLETGQRLKTLKSETHYISELTFNNAGTQFASFGTRDVELWRVADWTRTAQLRHKSLVWSAVFSNNDLRLTTVSENDLVIWDPAAGKQIHEMADVTHRKSRGRAMPSNDSLVYFDHNAVFSYQSEPFRALLPAIASPVSIHDVHTDPARMRVAVVSEDYSVSVWEWLDEGRESAVYRTPPGFAVKESSFTYSPENGSQFLYSEFNESSEIVSIDLDRPELSIERRDVGRRYLRLIPENVDGIMLYRTLGSGGFSILETASNTLHHVSSDVKQGPFIVDSRGVMAAARALESPQIQLYSLASSQFIAPPIELEKDIRLCRFSRDGKYLAASEISSGVVVWRIEDRQRVGSLGEDWSPTSTLDWGKDSECFSSGGEDGVLRVIKLGPALEIAWEVALSGAVRQVRFSPDGSKLISGRVDGSVTVWSSAEGKRLISGIRHEAEIVHIACHPTSELMMLVSWDGRLRFWSLEDGRPLTESLRWYGQWKSVQLSPDGSYYSFGTSDGGIEVRRVPSVRSSTEIPQWLPGFLENLAGQRLTSDDRLELIPWEERQAGIRSVLALKGTNPLLQWCRQIAEKTLDR